MDVCLSHISALRFMLRNANCKPGRRPIRASTTPPHSAPSTSKTRALQRALGTTRRLDVLVSSENGKRNDAFTNSHLTTAALPNGAFRQYRLPDGSAFYVCCPELAFLQLAATLPFDEAVYFGFALCSQYRIDDTALGGVAERSGPDKPLTSTNAISSFLDLLPAARGYAKARHVLGYVKDGSRSPMESGLAMGYGLPVHRGGFRLGEIQLNKPIRIFEGNDSGRRRYVVRIPDLTISAKGRDGTRRSVLLDFDADSVHASRRGLAKDSLRRNQIATCESLTHISMTTGQALEYQAYAHVAEQVRLALKRQNALRVSPKSQQPDDIARLERVHAARVSLWKKVVCPSRFRQQE